MLGSLHTSDIRRFIPRLVYQDLQSNSCAPLFKLDWDSVDQYKKDEYREHLDARAYPTDVKKRGTTQVQQFIAQVADENWYPTSLPPEIDEKVKDLTFALSHDYKRAIEHYTRLFVEERTQKWKFDTVVRDCCLTVSASAINVAFYLISDCMYNAESDGWYRGPHKRLYLHAMQYKFWRLYTGRGLVWDKSDLPKLEQSISYMKDDQAKKLYNEFMERLKSWSEEQEKFWDFANVPEETDTIANEADCIVVDTGPIPPEGVPEFMQKMKDKMKDTTEK